MFPKHLCSFFPFHVLKIHRHSVHADYCAIIKDFCSLLEISFLVAVPVYKVMNVTGTNFKGPKVYFSIYFSVSLN